MKAVEASYVGLNEKYILMNLRYRLVQYTRSSNRLVFPGCPRRTERRKGRHWLSSFIANVNDILKVPWRPHGMSSWYPYR